MRLNRRLLLQAGASALFVPPTFAQNSPGSNAGAPATTQLNLGRSWRVIESSASGLLFEGTWTRRGNTNVFDAHWREVRKNGGSVSDVIEFKGLNGDEVELFRRQLNGTYYGKLNAERTKVVSGRATWYGAGDVWTADFVF